jgi:metal-responsive CopG/Arc/MetJ family transcriptional regulator
MANSKAISIRIPDELLGKIDLLAEEKYKSHKGTPNRSLVVLDAIVDYFNTLSNSSEVEQLKTVSDSVNIIEFYELRDVVNTLSDTLKSLKQELTALSDNVLNSKESEPNNKTDKEFKHVQLSTITVSDTVIDDGLTANQLAERIGSTRASVLKEKDRYPATPVKFFNWVRKKDPDGFEWEYKEESGLFHKVKPLA